MVGVLIFLAVLAYIAFMIVLRGWVISVLWAWFMVPLGLPDIGVAAAVGLSCLMAVFLPTPAQMKNKEAEDRVQTMIYPFVSWVLALAIGWVAHQVMM